MLNVEDLARHSASKSAKKIKGSVLVKLAVPFVDGRLSAFRSISSTVQIQLFLIRADVRLLDDLVDDSRTYFHLTLGYLEVSHHKIDIENLRRVDVEYLKRCRIAADRIHNLQSIL